MTARLAILAVAAAIALAVLRRDARNAAARFIPPPAADFPEPAGFVPMAAWLPEPERAVPTVIRHSMEATS